MPHCSSALLQDGSALALVLAATPPASASKSSPAAHGSTDSSILVLGAMPPATASSGSPALHGRAAASGQRKQPRPVWISCPHGAWLSCPQRPTAQCSCLQPCRQQWQPRPVWLGISLCRRLSAGARACSRTRYRRCHRRCRCVTRWAQIQTRRRRTDNLSTSGLSTVPAAAALRGYLMGTI